MYSSFYDPTMENLEKEFSITYTCKMLTYKIFKYECILFNQKMINILNSLLYLCIFQKKIIVPFDNLVEQSTDSVIFTYIEPIVYKHVQYIYQKLRQISCLCVHVNNNFTEIKNDLEYLSELRYALSDELNILYKVCGDGMISQHLNNPYSLSLAFVWCQIHPEIQQIKFDKFDELLCYDFKSEDLQIIFKKYAWILNSDTNDPDPFDILLIMNQSYCQDKNITKMIYRLNHGDIVDSILFLQDLNVDIYIGDEAVLKKIVNCNEKQ